MTSLNYPDGAKATYTYDGDGHLSSVSDGNGHQVTYTLDAVGRVLTAKSTQGATRTFTYLDGQLSKYTQQLFAGGSTDTTTLNRNADDQIVAMSNPYGASSFGYDAAGQLAKVTDPTGAVTAYAYDANGNRASRTTSSQSDVYTYDAANELTSISRNGSGYSTFAYDTDGRLTNQVQTTGRSLKLTYGGTGRPTGIDRTVPEGHEVATLVYDGDGNPVSAATTVTEYGASTATTASTSLRWLPSQGPIHDVGQESSTVGTATTSSDLLYADSRELALTSAAGTTKVLDLARDAFGSSLSTSSTTGLAMADSYDNWGTDGWWPDTLRTVPVGFGYRGTVTVADVAIMHDRAYDAAFGRFTSPDPAPPVPGSPASVTPYPYANNDPLDRTDPSGDRSDSDTTLGDSPEHLAPEDSSCPVGNNLLYRHDKCFQESARSDPIWLPTRGYLPPTCLRTGVPCVSNVPNKGSKFLPEYTAQAKAIRRLSELRNQTPISQAVDWELAVDATQASKRADIVADGRAVYEVKNRTISTGSVDKQLTGYINRLHGVGLTAAGRGTGLVGWFVVYHAIWMVNGRWQLHGGFWAWKDPEEPGMIWFTDNEKKAEQEEQNAVPAGVDSHITAQLVGTTDPGCDCAGQADNGDEDQGDFEMEQLTNSEELDAELLALLEEDGLISSRG